MLVLIGELEGDYDDFYQRPRESLAVSMSREALEREIGTMKADSDNKYVEFEIEEVPLVVDQDSHVILLAAFGPKITELPDVAEVVEVLSGDMYRGETAGDACTPYGTVVGEWKLEGLDDTAES